MQNFLIQGDPMAPESTDLIAQRKLLKVGLPVPDGWRVLTGNNRDSVIARVAFRYEIGEESK